MQRRSNTPAMLDAKLIRAAVAELIGTFILVLIGMAVATAAILNRETAGQAYDSLALARSLASP